MQYEALPVDVTAEAATVICPPDAKSITDCWHSETRNCTIEESVGIVCCPGEILNLIDFLHIFFVVLIKVVISLFICFICLFSLSRVDVKLSPGTGINLF